MHCTKTITQSTLVNRMIYFSDSRLIQSKWADDQDDDSIFIECSSMLVILDHLFYILIQTLFDSSRLHALYDWNAVNINIYV